MNEIVISKDEYLEVCAQAVEVGAKTTVQGILIAGKALDDARKALPADQEFGQWRESRLPWLSRAMSAHWMNVYKKFGDSPVLNNFTPTVAYALAAPSVPESIIQQAVSKVESGEKVSVADIQRWKAEAEEEKRLRLNETTALKQRNTDLHKTIVELAKQGDALKAELEARPEPAVIEKVVEKTVEVLPDDYESLQRKAAKLGELKDDLAAANEALAKLKAEQARKVEDGIRQGLRQRQAEIDDFERRKVELERMIQAQVKMLSEFDAERTANAEAAKALSAFALAVGSLSADLMGLEIDALHPEVAAQAARAEGLLVEALGFVSKLRSLPIARIEKEAA